jgi:hypothetical protein
MAGEGGRQAPIPNMNPDAQSHEALKAMTDAANPAGSQAIADGWAELAAKSDEAGELFQRAVQNSEPGWTGDTAEAMRAHLNRIAAWTRQTGAAYQAASDAIGRQGEAAAVAKSSMPPPVPYDPAQMIRDATAGGNISELAALPFRMYEQKQKHDAAHDEAARIVAARDQTFGEAAGAVPAFTPPPLLNDGASAPADPVTVATPHPRAPRPDEGVRPAPRPVPPRPHPVNQPVPPGSPSGQPVPPGAAQVSPGGQPRPPGGPPVSPGGPRPGGAPAPMSGPVTPPPPGPPVSPPRPATVSSSAPPVANLGATPTTLPSDAFGPSGFGPSGTGGFGPGGPPPVTPSRVVAGAEAVPPAGPAKRTGDGERKRPEYLIEPDADGMFGSDAVTSPPVIGEV